MAIGNGRKQAWEEMIAFTNKKPRYLAGLIVMIFYYLNRGGDIGVPNISSS
jgi:hypothetical protein